jgi:hypothetical protein
VRGQLLRQQRSQRLPGVVQASPFRQDLYYRLNEGEQTDRDNAA